MSLRLRLSGPVNDERGLLGALGVRADPGSLRWSLHDGDRRVRLDLGGDGDPAGALAEEAPDA